MAARMPCHHHPSSTSSSYTAMISPRSGTRKVAFSFSTSAHGSSSLSHLSLTPATDNKKVFEDQLRGILCYRDENGEMICEGYDEGPRLGIRLPEKACFPWWASEFLNILDLGSRCVGKWSLLQIFCIFVLLFSNMIGRTPAGFFRKKKSSLWCDFWYCRPMGVQVTDFIQLATLQVCEDVDVLQLKSDQKRQLWAWN